MGTRDNAVKHSLTRSIFRFSNIKNGDTVGKVPDPSAVTLIEGTVTLTSGTVAPLPFLHPQYPNRGVGVSIGSDGSIGIWWGSEVNVSKGVVEVRIG
ncbi:MAG: hypothetical protein SO360_01765 [Bifidobacterium tsurumiense]|uniref:hypothetical protein n=1 Tax=Bifidobacterium tsurumiense TaxID=356829 RepID=UPI002A80FA53|nr:hypothetical protein [Bifidobacterium tsurumiense]MDY4677579.1 hypothetical protein [Bifidobacterium tsurumiense]